MSTPLFDGLRLYACEARRGATVALSNSNKHKGLARSASRRMKEIQIQIETDPDSLQTFTTSSQHSTQHHRLVIANTCHCQLYFEIVPNYVDSPEPEVRVGKVWLARR